MRKVREYALQRILLATGIVILATSAFAVNEMAKGLKFSTQGDDCWQDGAVTNVVAEGECYALVWKQNGATFEGLPAVPPNPSDVYALGQEAWLVDYFPVAELDAKTGRMRCPEQTIGIGKLPLWEAQNGTWTVYLLDTRYQRSDGTVAWGFDTTVTNAPRRINAYRAIPGLTDFTIGITRNPVSEIKVGGTSDGSPVVADIATEPKIVTVAFDLRGGTGEAPSRTRAYGDDYGELPVPTRTGYAFVGWFTDVEGGSQIFAESPTDGDRTLYAHWENNRYTIQFEPSGGSGEMADAEFVYDVAGTLPSCQFTRRDADFVVWVREPGGSVVFKDEGEILNLTDVADDVIRLRAVWAFHEGTVSEMLTDDAWTSGSTSETGAAVRQGDATHGEPYTAHLTSEGPGETWIETVVTNATRLVFEWKTTGRLSLSVDGETVRTLEGDTDWAEDVVVEIVQPGVHHVRWTCGCADEMSSGGVDAWVSNVRMHPGIHVEFDGNGAWEVPQPMLVYEGDRFTLPEQGQMRRWGREFLGWEVGAEVLQPGTELTARREDVFCTAMWTQGEPLPELSWDDPWEAVWEILSEAADLRLRENIYDIDAYMRFREWALVVLTPDGAAVAGAEVVMQSSHAWVSFALDSERLLARAPTNEDLVIERFERVERYDPWYESEYGVRFDFTVRVTGVTIGPRANSWNLEQVFGVEGASELRPEAFSRYDIEVEFIGSEGGKLSFRAGPWYPVSSFFMRPIAF